MSTLLLAWSPPISTHGKKISPNLRNARHSTYRLATLAVQLKQLLQNGDHRAGA